MPPAQPPLQQAGTPKTRLLFIDDDSSVLASLHLLFDSNYDTFSASTVGEGLQMVEKLHPKIIILDLKLPDRSGIEALREIRRIDSTAAVVILTGYSTRSAAEEAVRLGADDYLNKPFNSDYLKDRIQTLGLITRTRENKKECEDLVRDSLHNFCEFRDFQNASAAFLHDVSGPLSSLMVGSDLLNRKIKEADSISTHDISRLAEIMSESVGYLQALIHQWRSFSELQNLIHEKFEAQKAIDLALTQIMPQIASSGIVLQIQNQHEKVYLPGNHFAVARVIINILKNAIEVVSPTHGRVHLTAQKKERAFQLTVSDNGPGLDSAYADHIFDSGFTTKPQGKGLGLFISQKMIEAIGGKISVRSPGLLAGCDFVITLPFA